VGYCHKAQKRGSSEDRVILRGPIHDFEVELLLSIVLAVAETNVECYSTQWVVCATRYDSMEGAICWLIRLKRIYNF
jgi:hypothetical protein